MGMASVDDNAAQANHIVAAPLTSGSATGHGVNKPGRRREDDENLIVTHTLRSEGADDSEASEQSRPLTTSADRTRAAPIVAIQEIDGRQSKNQNGSGLGINSEVMYTLQAEHNHGIGYGKCVRRLTPKECLRLQGLPDEWLNLDPPVSDSAKYRIIGNSVAVPVVRWIAERMMQNQ
jgi:site-specific DNA-cytosine methylase